MSYDYNKERAEDMQAGQKAKESLQNALNALDSARGWGVYDILGGGFISSMIKHSKIDKASNYIAEAKYNLSRFGKELMDIQEFSNINLSTRDFWGFSDWFFDGFISDWIMQDRINEARGQVKQAIQHVNSILARL